jgi:large subunit ribosomal protein L10
LNRTQKEAFVADLEDGVRKAQAFALMSFSQLNVEQMTSFRLSLRKRDIHVKVVKNTLAKRVFDKTPFAGVSAHLQGPTLLAYGPGDPVITAKAIWEWAEKENFNVKIKSGAALGQLMSEAQLKALSKLPGKNELFVGFLWALKSSPTKFLYALQDAPRRLGYALNALKEKKAKEESAA